MSFFARVSREAKILIGLTCLAGASLIWFNYFTQQRSSLSPFSLSAPPSLSSSSGLPQRPTSTVPEGALPSIPTEISVTADTPEATNSDANIATDSANQASSSVAALDPEVEPSIPAEATLEGTASIPENTAENLVTNTTTEALPAPILPSEGASTIPEATPLEVSPSLDLVPEVVVVSPATPTTIGVSKDIQIAELPFLVTSPPSTLELDEEASESSGTTIVTQEAQRASINPFAPLILAEVASAEASNPAIVDVPIPEDPQVITNVDTPIVNTTEVIDVPVQPQPAPLVASPIIRNVAPPGLQANNLPRNLPGGTLPAAPSILRQAIPVPSIVDVPSNPDISTNAPEVAETPEQAPLASNQIPIVASPTLAAPPLNILPSSTIEPSAPTEPNPSLIASPLPVPVVENDASTIPETPVTPAEPSTVVGASELSRYLRDNNVLFTGSVVGPVSVGIFRSQSSDNPIVVTLGSSFPDTNFVLTSLQGQEAEFTHEQTTQTLPLDLRR